MFQNNMHACEVCGEMFSHTKHVRRHMIMVHNKTPDHACPMCGAIYSTARELCVHLQKVHNVTEDLLDVLSTGSNDSIPTNMEQDMDMSEKEDVNFNYGSSMDGMIQNGFDHSMDSADKTDYASASNGKVTVNNVNGKVKEEVSFKSEGSSAILSNPQETLAA